MTCFWDGLLKVLNPKDFSRIGKHKPRKAEDFIAMLKAMNIKTHDVAWNGMCPTPKQLEENAEAVRSYRPRTARHGYDCSAFDPFLFLVAQIFEVSISHRGAYATSLYTQQRRSRRTLHVASDTGHFRGLA